MKGKDSQVKVEIRVKVKFAVEIKVNLKVELKNKKLKSSRYQRPR
jgi:hypothetical protein